MCTDHLMIKHVYFCIDKKYYATLTNLNQRQLKYKINTNQQNNHNNNDNTDNKIIIVITMIIIWKITIIPIIIREANCDFKKKSTVHTSRKNLRLHIHIYLQTQLYMVCAYMYYKTESITARVMIHIILISAYEVPISDGLQM